MSLPPQVIHVKRKRTEEGPVPSFLKIEHSTKRHRSDAFLYRRHNPVAAAAARAAALAAEADADALAKRPPSIQVSSPDNRNKTARPELPAISPSKRRAPTTVPPAPLSEPRRFHLSRESLQNTREKINANSDVLGVVGIAGIRKTTRYRSSTVSSAAETAVFVERSKRRHKSGGSHSHSHSRHGSHSRHASRHRSRPVVVSSGLAVHADSPASTAPEDTAAGTAAPIPRLPKRPSWRGPLRPAASSSQTSTRPTTPTETTPPPAPAPTGPDKAPTPALPASLLNRQWDTDMDQLALEMNRYTLEMIGRNMARMEQESRASEAKPKQRVPDMEAEMAAEMAAQRRKAAYAKYKPRPTRRYAERHQAAGDAHAREDIHSLTSDEAASDSGADSETDEDDYVTETYVRVSGQEARQAGSAEPGNVGLLVFDNEPDIEVFYGAEEESEEELDDDEDENAENYYTHDYPEDEVASDDEFDRDPYHYRTGNASDMEEFTDSEEDKD